MTTCPQHPNATWREVTTGRRVCLMPHPRPVRVHRRPMASRPPRIGLPWREVAPAAAVAAQDDDEASSDPGTEAVAALTAVEVPTVPVLVEAGTHDEPEDLAVEAPPDSGGSPEGASTVIPWPAAADHETRDVIDVFIRERDRLGVELARVDQQLEQLTQVRERLLTLRSAVEDTLGLYAEHLTASAVA